MKAFRHAVVATMCSLLVATSVASAQNGNAQAETLFQRARELMTQKKYAEACAAFSSSLKLEATATTLYSLAVCRELGGELASAWGLFTDVTRVYRNSSDATAIELVRTASERAKKLEPRLSKLVIDVPSAHRLAGLEVRRNGELVDTGAWGLALPLDGGSYEITAAAPNHTPWKTTIEIKPEADAQAVAIPALEAAPPPRPERVVADSTDPAPPRGEAPRSRIVPLLLAGGALALGGAALGFELWGRGRYDDAQVALDGGDRTRADELYASANTRRYVATGFGIAALGCAGVAVYLVFRGGGDAAANDRTRSTVFVPVISREQAGLGLTMAW